MIYNVVFVVNAKNKTERILKIISEGFSQLNLKFYDLYILCALTSSCVVLCRKCHVFVPLHQRLCRTIL